MPSNSPLPSLVGIARLAADSGLLEAKSRVEYREIETRRFLTRCSSDRVPFQWTINPYRGCEFGCRYCYARYTHEFMELREWREFEEKIFAKRWSAAEFRRELVRTPRAELIAIGTATDPYQPAERRYEVTRRILEVFARDRGRRLAITTKSPLVTRDIDLLQAIGRANVLSVHLTVTTTDARLARILEPYAPRPELRLEAVRKLAEAGIRAGVFSAPVMPLLNDSEASLDAVAAAAREARAASWGGNVLFLKPCAQQVFFPMLEREFPHLLSRYRQRFEANAYLGGAYAETIQARIERVRARHGLARRIDEYQPAEWAGDEQMSLAF